MANDNMIMGQPIAENAPPQYYQMLSNIVSNTSQIEANRIAGHYQLMGQLVSNLSNSVSQGLTNYYNYKLKSEELEMKRELHDIQYRRESLSLKNDMREQRRLDARDEKVVELRDSLGPIGAMLGGRADLDTDYILSSLATIENAKYSLDPEVRSVANNMISDLEKVTDSSGISVLNAIRAVADDNVSDPTYRLALSTVASNPKRYGQLATDADMKIRFLSGVDPEKDLELGAWMQDAGGESQLFAGIQGQPEKMIQYQTRFGERQVDLMYLGDSNSPEAVAAFQKIAEAKALDLDSGDPFKPRTRKALSEILGSSYIGSRNELLREGLGVDDGLANKSAKASNGVAVVVGQNPESRATIQAASALASTAKPGSTIHTSASLLAQTDLSPERRALAAEELGRDFTTAIGWQSGVEGAIMVIPAGKIAGPLTKLVGPKLSSLIIRRATQAGGGRVTNQSLRSTLAAPELAGDLSSAARMSALGGGTARGTRATTGAATAAGLELGPLGKGGAFIGGAALADRLVESLTMDNATQRATIEAVSKMNAVDKYHFLKGASEAGFLGQFSTRELAKIYDQDIVRVEDVSDTFNMFEKAFVGLKAAGAGIGNFFGSTNAKEELASNDVDKAFATVQSILSMDLTGADKGTIEDARFQFEQAANKINNVFRTNTLSGVMKNMDFVADPITAMGYYKSNILEDWHKDGVRISDGAYSGLDWRDVFFSSAPRRFGTAARVSERTLRSEQAQQLNLPSQGLRSQDAFNSLRPGGSAGSGGSMADRAASELGGKAE